MANGIACVIIIILLQGDPSQDRHTELLREQIYYLRSLYVTKYALCTLVCCQSTIINVVNCVCFFCFNVILIQQASLAERAITTPAANYQSNGVDLIV